MNLIVVVVVVKVFVDLLLLLMLLFLLADAVCYLHVLIVSRVTEELSVVGDSTNQGIQMKNNWNIAVIILLTSVCC